MNCIELPNDKQNASLLKGLVILVWVVVVNICLFVFSLSSCISCSVHLFCLVFLYHEVSKALNSLWYFLFGWSCILALLYDKLYSMLRYACEFGV